MKKTWMQKLAGGKPPHVVQLESAFAGVPAGARLFIASPRLLDERIALIPRGMVRDPVDLRAELAAEQGADATCPVSTAIFLRIVAEAALERIAGGTPAAEVTPFWRVIAPGSKIAGKLSCGDDYLQLMRDMERTAPA
ncbi:hypothetical protein GWI72_13655 [Microvirga tunisiensis]|uniref:Uncharacterized protein n=1 Tax=Pannonibacter tanglangensis TaxID=2750084 RepID=A0A7X5J9U3_9HYPH|nr:hypothetical protein [Pannonibacter sp. XCT-53]NBN79317.1 hypothetical protein [Pannonibacter sp. XCT-53]